LAWLCPRCSRLVDRSWDQGVPSLGGAVEGRSRSRDLNCRQEVFRLPGDAAGCDHDVRTGPARSPTVIEVLEPRRAVSPVLSTTRPFTFLRIGLKAEERNLAVTRSARTRRAVSWPLETPSHDRRRGKLVPPQAEIPSHPIPPVATSPRSGFVRVIIPRFDYQHSRRSPFM